MSEGFIRVPFADLVWDGRHACSAKCRHLEHNFAYKCRVFGQLESFPGPEGPDEPLPERSPKCIEAQVEP